MDKSEEVKSLRAVFKAGEHYIRQAEDVLSAEASQETDKSVELLRNISRFLDRVRNKWMQKKRTHLKATNQQRLDDLMKNLTKLEKRLEQYVEEREELGSLIERVRLENEPGTDLSQEDISIPNFDESKYYYSDRLQSELIKVEPPRW